MVKIISDKRRTSRTYRDNEINLFEKHRWSHPNLVRFIAYDPSHCWISTRFLGATLEDVLEVQRVRMRSSGQWTQLPEACIWGLLQDVMAGLAYLHYGVAADYHGTQRTPTNHKALAVNITAAAVSLDVRHSNELGFPRAVISNLACATEKPLDVEIDEWEDAAMDLEQLAAIFHEMAHGRTYPVSLAQFSCSRLPLCFSQLTGHESRWRRLEVSNIGVTALHLRQFRTAHSSKAPQSRCQGCCGTCWTASATGQKASTPAPSF